jgi:hypothetical protein
MSVRQPSQRASSRRGLSPAKKKKIRAPTTLAAQTEGFGGPTTGEKWMREVNLKFTLKDGERAGVETPFWCHLGSHLCWYRTYLHPSLMARLNLCIKAEFATLYFFHSDPSVCRIVFACWDISLSPWPIWTTHTFYYILTQDSWCI